jgi:protein arginine kinase activator
MRCMHKDCDKQATVHITVIENQKVSELHLCQEHGAAEQLTLLKGQGPEAGKASPSAAESAQAAAAKVKGGANACPECGLNWATFIQSGRLGCVRDYEVFRKDLDAVIRQTQQMGRRHTGKVPARAGGGGDPAARELDRLKDALNRAVTRENYEKAAELRDKIRDFENGMAAAKPVHPKSV